MSRMELAHLKTGNVLIWPGFDIHCTVQEVMPLRGILVKIDVTNEQLFVDAEEVLDELEVFV